LRSALLSGPWNDLGNAPATNASDLGIDIIAEQVMLLTNTMLLLYSPECVEGRFSEVELWFISARQAGLGSCVSS
jgi:hypothetical protein